MSRCRASNKLPYGNLPRLLIAWLGSRLKRCGPKAAILVLGRSLAGFMRTARRHEQMTAVSTSRGSAPAYATK